MAVDEMENIPDTVFDTTGSVFHHFLVRNL
jgi:hypothetical protein